MNLKLLSKVSILSLALLCTSSFAAEAYKSKGSETSKAKAAPKITLGNGDKNWIIVEGITRSDDTLTVPEVQIDGNGWLVMHPFEGGKPNGDKYVAASYLENGKNTNVDIKIHKGVETGEMFIMMLHRDANENKVLDFVFVSDTAVMDTAVFEGTKMIAHAIPAP